MVFEILNIVAPVFLVVGTGYLAVKLGLFDDVLIDNLMKFAVQIAIPCLLFRATSTIDLASAFDWRMMLAYYGAAITCFVLTYVLMRKVFGRRPGEAVAIGFAALFSNLVLLGLPISERAWGIGNMAPSFALVSVNAPICYLIGITAMEMLRADGRNAADTTRVVLIAMFRNSMMIGIALGFMVNLGSIPLPGALSSAVDLFARPQDSLLVKLDQIFEPAVNLVGVDTVLIDQIPGLDPWRCKVPDKEWCVIRAKAEAED